MAPKRDRARAMPMLPVTSMLAAISGKPVQSRLVCRKVKVRLTSTSLRLCSVLRFGQALRQLLQEGPAGQAMPPADPAPQGADAAGQATSQAAAPSTEPDDGTAETVAPESALLASMWPQPAPVAALPLPVAAPPATAVAAQAGAATDGSVRAADLALPSTGAPAAALASGPPPAAAPTDATAMAAAAVAAARVAPAEAPDGLVPQGPDRASVTGIMAADQRLTEAADAAPSTDTVTRRPQALVDALGERIAWQLQRGHDRVVIRLDPPMRGQIEIQIRHDAAGAMQVQLQASHGDVVRQLQAIGEHLRQELSQRQGGADVSVSVAQQPRDHDGRQRQDRQPPTQQQPGRALDDTQGTDGAASFALATDDAR